MHFSPADDAVPNTLRLVERRRDEVSRLAVVIKQVINEGALSESSPPAR